FFVILLQILPGLVNMTMPRLPAEFWRVRFSYLIVQVTSCTPTCIPLPPDHLTLLHILNDFNSGHIKMTIAVQRAVFVANRNDNTEASETRPRSAFFCMNDLPRGKRIDRSLVRLHQVDPSVERAFPGKRIVSPAKRGGDAVFSEGIHFDSPFPRSTSTAREITGGIGTPS